MRELVLELHHRQRRIQVRGKRLRVHIRIRSGKRQGAFVVGDRGQGDAVRILRGEIHGRGSEVREGEHHRLVHLLRLLPHGAGEDGLRIEYAGSCHRRRLKYEGKTLREGLRQQRQVEPGPGGELGILAKRQPDLLSALEHLRDPGD